MGGRAFVHGGLLLEPARADDDEPAPPVDGEGAPDQPADGSLWCLDVGTCEWSLPETLGTAPPPLCAHQMCAHASSLFLFGGRASAAHASAASADLFRLATSTLTWEQLPAVAAPGASAPIGRWGHTLTSAGSRLFLFGGQSQAGELLAGPCVYDLGTRNWEAPVLTGAQPQPRRNHAATVWGRHLLVSLGEGRPDGAAEGTPAEPISEIALIELGSMASRSKRPAALSDGTERLGCTTHGSSAVRSGHSLLAGRQLLLLCGAGSEAGRALPLVYVPMGYMLQQDEQAEEIGRAHV